MHEVFDERSVWLESEASLWVTVSAEISCVRARVKTFSKSSILSFISANTSTTLKEHRVGFNFGGGSGPPVPLIVISRGWQLA